MPIIWGFNLSEMRWDAFSSKKMYDKKWYLRRERFIAYQLAMNIGLAAECTATYSLSKYEDLQTNIEHMSGYTAQVHNNNIIDSAIVTIVFCVLVATLYGANLFFLVFWPQRRYPRWYHMAKLALALVITLGVGIAAFTSTIIVASHSARITGVDATTAQTYTDLYFRPPLVYNDWAVNIAWVVLIWPAFLCTVASSYFMFAAYLHDRRFGPVPKGSGAGSSIGEKDVEGTPMHDDASHDTVLSTSTPGGAVNDENATSPGGNANATPVVAPPFGGETC